MNRAWKNYSVRSLVLIKWTELWMEDWRVWSVLDLLLKVILGAKSGVSGIFRDVLV